MIWLNNKERYGALSIALHWLMALLLIAVYGCMNLREFYPEGGSVEQYLAKWHTMLGLFVLVLLAIRVLVLFAGEHPKNQADTPNWRARSARWMHLALYAFMLVMPLLGWLLLSAQGEEIPYFGINLPPLIAKSASVAEWMEEIHEVGGTIGYILIGMHTAAALYHHYFLRDNSLRRILPWHSK